MTVPMACSDITSKEAEGQLIVPQGGVMVQIPHVVSTDSLGGGGDPLYQQDEGPRFPSENSTEKVQEGDPRGGVEEPRAAA